MNATDAITKSVSTMRTVASAARICPDTKLHGARRETSIRWLNIVT